MRSGPCRLRSAKLLRVLQRAGFERPGARAPAHDARLIAATNQDPFMLVETQQFRADLFIGSTSFPQVPPCASAGRYPLLVRHFAHQCATTCTKRLTPFLKTMRGASTPGRATFVNQV